MDWFYILVSFLRTNLANERILDYKSDLWRYNAEVLDDKLWFSAMRDSSNGIIFYIYLDIDVEYLDRRWEGRH